MTAFSTLKKVIIDSRLFYYFLMYLLEAKKSSSHDQTLIFVDNR